MECYITGIVKKSVKIYITHKIYIKKTVALFINKGENDDKKQ